VKERKLTPSRTQKRATFANRLILSGVLALAFGCDEDVAIQPDCETDPDCRMASTLDAGATGTGSPDTGTTPTVPPADSGVAAPDAQVVTDAGNADSGVIADAGVMMPVDAGFPPPEFIDLTGHYDTHYLLDLSAYLWNLGDLAGPLDIIDQVLAGNIMTGITSLDNAIQSAISQFIPPWLVNVVTVLNNAANLFDEVETDGHMVIKQNTVSSTTTFSTLTSTESWNQLTVRIIEGCPMGRNDPNYPACARQPIPISSQNMIGPVEVGIRIQPFTGTATTTYPVAPFEFPSREIEIELTKLLRIAIDVAIRIETNNQVMGLQDALDRAIDCAGLEAEALRLANNVSMTLAPSIAAVVRQACEDVKQDTMDAVLGTVEAVGVDWEVLVFEQLGEGVDNNANGSADTIQVLTTPETISGRFRAVVSDPVGGSWEGTNRNP